MELPAHSNFPSGENEEKIYFELFQALKNHSGIEEEMFDLLMHFSPFVGHSIPSHQDMSFKKKDSNRESDLENQKQSKITFVLEKLEMYFNSQIALLFECNEKNIQSFKESQSLSKQQLDSACTCIEKLQVLIGHKQTVEKFRHIISVHMDMLLRHHVLHNQSDCSNLSKLAVEFHSLFSFVELLVRKVIHILTCANIFKDNNKKLLFIQDTILEKLSIQLLTLSDSIQQSFLKISLKHDKSDIARTKANSKFSNIASDGLSLSVDALSNFATIVNEFLSLENLLESFDVLAVTGCSTFPSKKGVLKHQSLELPDLIKTSQQSNGHQCSGCYEKMAWCETLREVAPTLERSLGTCLQKTSDKLLSKVKETCKSSGAANVDIVSSASRILENASLTAPKKSFAFLGSILHLIIKWLPFSIIGKKHRFLSKLRIDFVDIVNQILKVAKPTIMDLIEETPDKNSPSILPTLLASCRDVVLVLQHCDQKLRQDHRLPFHSTVQMYKSFCNHIEQFLIQYHKSRLSTVILHDAESNYWSDPRSFAEDEKCSYSIEMWQPYMYNLHKELFLCLDDYSAQKIISEIFCDSLCILANRYCNCRPSFKRHSQIQRDVAEILRFSFIFLWQIQIKPHDICFINDYSCSTEVFMKLHMACNDLFTCISVLTSPLGDLHGIVTMLRTYERQRSPPCLWLSCLNRTLFPIGWDGRSSSLSDAAFVFCILIQLKENCDHRLGLTLQALTARQCFLFDKLFDYMQASKSPTLLALHRLFQTELFQDAFPWNFLLKSEFSAKADVGHAFINFNFFHENFHQLMPWQVILHKGLLCNFKTALFPAINCLSFYCMSSFSTSLCKRLPPEVTDCLPDVSGNDDNEMVHIITCLLLQGLRCFAVSLPEFIISLLVKIDEKLHQCLPDVSLIFGTYGAHILIHLTSLFLTDLERLKECFSVEKSPSAIAILAKVAHSLLQLGNMSDNDGEGDAKSGSKLLSNEINSFKNCTHSLFSHLENVEHGQECFDISVFTYLLQTGKVSNETKDAMASISDWIISHFTSVLQLLDCSYPFKEARSAAANHMFLEWDWTRSLPGCLTSSSPDVVSRLLCQRPDFQENAHVTSEEKEMADFIKCAFKIRC